MRRVVLLLALLLCRARLVVGADGVRSAVRASMFPEDPGPRFLVRVVCWQRHLLGFCADLALIFLSLLPTPGALLLTRTCRLCTNTLPALLRSPACCPASPPKHTTQTTTANTPPPHQGFMNWNAIRHVPGSSSQPNADTIKVVRDQATAASFNNMVMIINAGCDHKFWQVRE